MVNNAAFTKRLEKILQEYELSATAFADKVEVGRATISHLLSGRNKPSLDFVLKVISAFPEVDLYWLLNGKGTFPKSNLETPAPLFENPTENVSSISQTDVLPTAQEIKKKATPSTLENTAVFKNNVNTSSNTSKIKRIVIFFENGQFESYEG